MKPWPQNPLLYEINTWVWLEELSRKYGRAVSLGTVPHEEWSALAALGFDAVWLMGVWERSPAGRKIANGNPGLTASFKQALPDFTPADNAGSPYCVRRYDADPRLGGRQGLAAARAELASRGLRLLLDFVPNHVAPDHPWTREHPDFFVPGSPADARREPRAFLKLHGRVVACGRDPYYPAWPDVAQLDVFRPALRQAAADTLLDIASQCDGARCDMAMLVLNDVFESTWGARVGPPPPTEYWAHVISAVKAARPDFLFLAEAYWDREWDLQQQGFDYCYDKCLYDRLAHDQAENVRLHLCADPAYQQRLIRFIENHDEPRAAAAFPAPRARAAAVIMSTIPGAKLFYEGQFEGRTARLPVFLGRRPDEPADRALQAFYRRLLKAVGDGLCQGVWRFCDRTGWPDNATFQNLVAWCWSHGPHGHLVVVNFSDAPAQGRVRLPWDNLAGRSWPLRDVLGETLYVRDGDELINPGLYVDLPAWGFHVLSLQGGPAATRSSFPCPGVDSAPPKT